MKKTDFTYLSVAVAALISLGGCASTGTTKTTATNNSGVTMTWEAQFYGQYNTITVNGTAATVSTKSEWGKTVSYMENYC